MRWQTVLLTLIHCALAGVNPFEPDVKPEIGYVCAFGDVNGDRLTDILVYRDTPAAKDGSIGHELAWLLQTQQGSFNNGTIIHLLYDTAKTGPPKCSVGDYDGKSSLDLLVTTKTKNDPPTYSFTLYLGPRSGGTVSFSILPLQKVELREEPIFWDINSDGLTDIFGFTTSNKFYCRLGTEKEGGLPELPCEHLFHDIESTLADLVPFAGMPPSYVDLNGDLSAEIVFPFKSKDDKLVLQAWKRSGSGNTQWVLAEGLIPPLPTDDNKHFAAPIVADLDGDANIEIAVPVCKEDECQTVSKFLIWKSGKSDENSWEESVLDMNDLSIVRDGDSRVIFRPGEFTQNGFPNLVATMIVKARKASSAYILDNEICNECTTNFKRRFLVRRDMSNFVHHYELDLGVVQMAAFFDLKEDGNLDVLAEYAYKNRTNFSFIRLKDTGDTTFLKVQTFTNVCSKRECLEGSGRNDIGSGIAWTGVCVNFEMTDSWTSGKKESVSCQLAQTTSRALSTPYVLFGLGRSPNFVDLIVVGAPMNSDQRTKQAAIFKQLVPNSRVLVIPPDKTYGTTWQHRLFVTPSQLIIQSLIVLSSVCLILLVVVLILHFRERKEDRVERQAQSHRFHFDAM